MTGVQRSVAAGMVLVAPAVANAQVATSQAAARPAVAPSLTMTVEGPSRVEAGVGGASPAIWLFSERAPVDGPLATDRPGFSDTFAVVPRGYTHFESGYTFSYDREGTARTRNHLLGEFALRAGLFDNFELRIEWSGFSFTDSVFEGTSRWAGRRITVEDHSDGGTDMNIGFKTQILKQDGLIPNLSLVPAVYFPTGASGKTTGDVDPELRLAYHYGLTERWSLYGVGQVAALSDGDGRFVQSGASIATAYAFTPRLSGFIEYFGLYPSARDTDAQHNINFGPVFLIDDNMQIDARVGFGLNEDAPDFFATIGFSIRF